MGNLKELLHRAASGVQTALMWEEPGRSRAHIRSLGKVEGHMLVIGGKPHTALTQ